MNNSRNASLTVLGAALLSCVVPTAIATADGNPAAASTDPGDLGTQWWQLVLSIPGVQNPFLDQTGASCGIGQRGNTWFLYSSSLGPLIELKCTIPAGKPILLAVVAAICVPYPGETIKQNVQFCKEAVDPSDVLTLKIDGKARNDLIERRTSTRPFALPVPDDNVFGFATGIFAAVHDGYFAKLPPLEPGLHTVRVRGGITAEGYLVDTRYRLRIERPAKELPTFP